MSDFWTHKRVAVLGGAGFVASHLVPMLSDAGAFVIILDNGSRGENRYGHPNVQAYHCDVTDLEWLVYRFEGIDVVLNLAAYVAGVEYNQAHQTEMFNRNMALQMVPVEAAGRAGVGSFLQVSSVCVYAEGYNSPCREDNGHLGEPTGANSGYSWAKRMGERVALLSSIPHVVVVRPSNVVGERDYFDNRAHVVPALIYKAQTDPVIQVNGSGQERREFIYAGDVARGMMSAVEHGPDRGVFNLGTNGDTCVSIGDLVGMIQRATGTDNKSVRFSRQFDPGDQERWSDASRANAMLGWHHEVGIEDAVKRTAREYLIRVGFEGL